MPDIAEPRIFFGVQDQIRSAVSAKYWYNKWLYETPEGWSYQISKQWGRALAYQMGADKPSSNARSSGSRGGESKDDGPGMRLLNKMTNALIHATPVLGSGVRAINAIRSGDKKGAALNATFAVVERIGVVGGLRTLGGFQCWKSGFERCKWRFGIFAQ